MAGDLTCTGCGEYAGENVSQVVAARDAEIERLRAYLLETSERLHQIVSYGVVFSRGDIRALANDMMIVAYNELEGE